MYEFRGVLILDQKKQWYLPIKVNEYRLYKENLPVTSTTYGMVWKSNMKFNPKSKKRVYRNANLVIPANIKEMELTVNEENFPKTFLYLVQNDLDKYLKENPNLMRLEDYKITHTQINPITDNYGSSTFSVSVSINDRIFCTEVLIIDFEFDFVTVGSAMIGGYRFTVYNHHLDDKGDNDSTNYIYLDRTYLPVKYRKIYKPLKEIFNNSFTIEEYMRKVKEVIAKYFTYRLNELGVES